MNKLIIVYFFVVAMISYVSADNSENKESIILPTNNPVERYLIDWTDNFIWNRIVNIYDYKSDSWDESVLLAQEYLSEKGGGVIYFPSGEYQFRDNIKLKSGIVLRGEEALQTEKWNPVIPEDEPARITDAREARYTLGTKFFFPVYNPVNKNNGTPIQSSFKGVCLEDNSQTNYCGVLNIEFNNGHIEFGELASMQKDYQDGKKLNAYLVYGCILKNAAVASKGIPIENQHPWQRFTDSDFGAITIYASADVLIANNRIPESGQSNFTMENFLVYPDTKSVGNPEKLVEVVVNFDYDNRSGIRVNPHPAMKELDIWYKHEELQKAVENGTYESMISPGSLAKGIVIRENYIFCTGRAAIKTGGDGAFIGYNIIRFKPSVVLATSDGIKMDGFSNGNRAIEVRGWRWTMEANDFEVHSNYTIDGIKYNDGEGLMHEAWENVGVRDSKMINNTGNRYLSFWRVPAKGLIIKGNHIHIYRDFYSIYVNSQARIKSDLFVDLPVENVEILDNITEKSGIKVIGLKGKGNIIRGNKHANPGEGIIEDHVNSVIDSNLGYKILIGK